MKTHRNTLALLIALAVGVNPTLYAGPRGGGSAPSAPARSAPMSAPASRPAAPSAPASRPASAWGSSTTINRSAPASVDRTDAVVANKTRATGTNGQSRDEAFTAPAAPRVTSNNGQTYTDSGSGVYSRGGNNYYRDDNNRFVPQTVVINHSPYPVVYYGGSYGYWNGPSFVPYNDSMVAYTPVYHGSGHGFLVFLEIIAVLVILGLIAWGVYYWLNREVQYATDPSGGRDTDYRRGNNRTGENPSFVNVGGSGHIPPTTPAAPTPGFDVHTPGDWSKVGPGSLVTLSDELSGVQGKEFVVESIATLTERNKLATWMFFSFEGDPGIELMAKIVDNNITLRRLERVDEPTPMTRKELIQSGYQMLFVAPENPDDFDPAKLRYAAEIPDWDNNQKTATTTFVMKDQGEMHGYTTTRPLASGMPDNLKTTIIEYGAAPKRDEAHPQGSENPDPLRNNLILLETGDLVEYFLASPVKFSEVSVEHVA